MDIQEEEVLTPAQADDAYAARVARCAPVARKVLMIIAKNLETIELGDAQKCSTSLNATAAEVLQLYVDENINWGDKVFIGQLAMQPLAHLQEKLETSLSISWDKAIGKLFGKDSLDLTFGEIEAILKREPDMVE